MEGVEKPDLDSAEGHRLRGLFLRRFSLQQSLFRRNHGVADSVVAGGFAYLSASCRPAACVECF